MENTHVPRLIVWAAGWNKGRKRKRRRKKEDTSLSAQFANENIGVTESTAVSSSVYVFTRILELYVKLSILHTS